jgi:hypothetical protein
VSEKDIGAVLRANQITAWCMVGTVVALIIRIILRRKK